MTAFEPQILHVNFLMGHEEVAVEADLLAEVKIRVVRQMAEQLAEQLYDAKGGVILSPVTFTVNVDEVIGADRIAATVNLQRLPDPLDGEYVLHGGQMHGRIVRVGEPAPRYYRIPVVLPVSVYSTRGPVTLEYELVPGGARAYRFVRELS